MVERKTTHRPRNQLAMARLEALIAKEFGPVTSIRLPVLCMGGDGKGIAYLNEIPYCETESNPDFQTNVTSQALVACSRHERKADTALPPTTQYLLALRTMATWVMGEC